MLNEIDIVKLQKQLLPTGRAFLVNDNYYKETVTSKNIIYGLLYNGIAARDSRGICPVGYHIPTEAEFDTLIDFCGGSTVAGKKLKEIGITHWAGSNNGTDDYGFSALPGGLYNTSTFSGLGTSANFMTSSNDGSGNMIIKSLSVLDSVVTNIMYQYIQVSVRFLKNDSINNGSCTDIDGNVYQTVKIGSQVWSTKNLITTRYNDGSLIEIEPSEVVGAQCPYNNDINNAYSFSTVTNENISSVFGKLLFGLAGERVKAINSGIGILNQIIPDNEYYSADDATRAENLLGIYSEDSNTLENRKLSIYRKMQFPNNTKGRQHKSYLQHQLNQAGFNCKIYEWDDVKNYVISTEHSTGTEHSSDTEHVSLLFPSYDQIIANFINPNQEDEIMLTLSNVVNTFWISSADFNTPMNLPANRVTEFRNLILHIKPLYTIGLIKVTIS